LREPYTEALDACTNNGGSGSVAAASTRLLVPSTLTFLASRGLR
jgi:hypothetical protein